MLCNNAVCAVVVLFLERGKGVDPYFNGDDGNLVSGLTGT